MWETVLILGKAGRGVEPAMLVAAETNSYHRYGGGFATLSLGFWHAVASVLSYWC